MYISKDKSYILNHTSYIAYTYEKAPSNEGALK